MRKGEFARHIGVSPGRVTQMISEGLIGRDALEGLGPRAMIKVEVAQAQIRARRDPGQAVGNGLDTRVDGAAPAVSAPESPATPPAPLEDDVTSKIKAARLEAELRKNRIAAREEAVASGELVRAADVRAQMGKLAQTLEDENAGMLADFAAAIAERFGIEQRDVLHLLKTVRTDKKRQAAERLRALAEAEPERVPAQLGGDASEPTEVAAAA